MEMMKAVMKKSGYLVERGGSESGEGHSKLHSLVTSLRQCGKGAQVTCPVYLL